MLFIMYFVVPYSTKTAQTPIIYYILYLLSITSCNGYHNVQFTQVVGVYFNDWQIEKYTELLIAVLRRTVGGGGSGATLDTG